MAIFARFGSVGENVKHVQEMLNLLGGPALVVDGVFGPKTSARVLQFQRSAKLDADGIVGPLTAQALSSEVMKRLLQTSYSVE